MFYPHIMNSGFHNSTGEDESLSEKSFYYTCNNSPKLRMKFVTRDSDTGITDELYILLGQMTEVECSKSPVPSNRIINGCRLILEFFEVDYNAYLMLGNNEVGY